jgi:UDP-glucose 4-epimerase
MAAVRVVVTGGAGFIGSHVVEALLARGDEVHVLDNLATGKRENVPDGARLHEADIRTDAARVFAEARPEACIHLAAQADVRVSVERPDYDADVNVLGTIGVLEAARAHDTKVVFSSTGGAIYGEVDGPAAEDAPRRPLAPYGTSKLAGEEYLWTYNRLYGSEHVVLRYGNVYGPRQDPLGEAGVIAIFCGKLIEGQKPTVFGDGLQTRDYVYVGDVVAANLRAAESQATGPFNVGTGRQTSVLDIVDALRKFADGDFEPEMAPERPGEVQHIALDYARAREELGYEPKVDLNEGLEITLNSVRAAAQG